MSDDWFAKYYAAIADSTAKRVGEQFGLDELGLEARYDTTPITVKQHAAYLPMSVEVAMDAGLMTEEQARARGWTPALPPPPVPWWRRARWRWQAQREQAGRRAGGWIAGVDLSERDE